MLRQILGLFLLSSCSLGVVKKGGDDPYLYDAAREYSSEELQELSGEVVSTARRDPPVGKLEELFGKGQEPLKRIGIVVFESQIQPTRNGLADFDEVYLSAQGKQLLTEKLLTVWEESITTLASEVEYVPTKKLKSSKVFKSFGLPEDDHVKAKRVALAPDDIFFLEKGQKATTDTILNPRGMRDMSLLLVPASEFMQGPKWSEQHKQFVNEVMKREKLDAVLVVMSEISWSKGRIDKHSGENIPEELVVSLKASTLVSLSEYRKRAQKAKLPEPPSVSLCYRAHEGELKVPVNLSFAEEERTFSSIEERILNPALKVYKDLTVMTVERILAELRKTH